jgi:hypothetical protein
MTQTSDKPIRLNHTRSKVTVSDRALATFAALRETEQASPTQAIGLISTASGLGLVLDVPGPTDRIISRDGVPVCFVAADLERTLRGRVLDFSGPKGQERFTLERSYGSGGTAPGDSSDDAAEVFTTLPATTPVKSDDVNMQGTSNGMAEDLVEVVEDKRPDGYGFHFKVKANDRLYRIEPARDPQQPRFWCFRIFRCLPSRMVDVTERPWLGAGGMTWNEVPVAAEAIRADLNGWLAVQSLEQLRQWITEEKQPDLGAVATR